MNITRHTQTLNGADVQMSVYDNGTGAAEMHCMIHVMNREATFRAQLHTVLDAYDAVISQFHNRFKAVFARYFLSDAANQTDDVYRNDRARCALSVIQQPPLDGTKVAMWCYLMADTDVRITDNGFCEAGHGSYRHLWAGSRYNTSVGSELQTLNLLNEFNLQLLGEGCSLAGNSIRTWFFVNDIDNNYQGVVKARNQVFLAHGLTKDSHFIASTGIGGRQADHNIAVQMDSYSISGIDSCQIHYLYASDHLNRTSDYGVSFERGTYIDYGDRRHVFVSGTASIDNRGRVMYPGDIINQTHRMFENIEALLSEAECTWSDVSELVVYLRDMADYAVVSKIIAKKFPSVPYLIVNASVCRPGWLVEAECMAVKSITFRSPPF